MLERTYHPLSARANATGHQCTDSDSSSETGLIAIAIMSLATTGDENVSGPSEITATLTDTAQSAVMVRNARSAFLGSFGRVI